MPEVAGLLPASVHVFRRCKNITLRAPSQPSKHEYKKANSHQEGYCWGNSQTSYRCTIPSPTIAHSLSVNVIFSFLLYIAHQHVKYFVYFLSSHKILPRSDIAHHLDIFFIFHMFAIWQDNLHQLPLGFSALGLLKLARDLQMETILYAIQIWIKYIKYSPHLCLSPENGLSSNSPFTMLIIVHHVQSEATWWVHWWYQWRFLVNRMRLVVGLLFSSWDSCTRIVHVSLDEQLYWHLW